MPISEDDLRGLSATEREALLAVDEDDEDVAQELRGERTESKSEGAAEVDEPETTTEEDAAAAAAAIAAAPAADPAKPAGVEAEVEADEPEIDDVAPARATPTDIDDQRKALNAREDESMQKLLDGEITQEDHAKTKNEVRASLDKLLIAEATDRAAERMEQNAMMKDYNADMRDTVKLGKAAGLDYTSDALKDKFNRAVVMFSKELSEQGVFDRPGNLANSKQALADAHALMLRRAGKATPVAATPAAAPAAPAAKERPAPDRSKLGLTLAVVPTAADPRITSEFAHLDGITEPAALERELAKLSPDAQERYLGA